MLAMPQISWWIDVIQNVLSIFSSVSCLLLFLVTSVSFSCLPNYQNFIDKYFEMIVLTLDSEEDYYNQT